MTGRNILVIGATGYIGSRLVPRLVAGGYPVRCLVRDPGRAADQPWASQVEFVTGDVLEPSTLAAAFRDIDTVYYLVHSLGSAQGDFVKLDRTAAHNAGRAAFAANVRRIIYLGGLGRRDDKQSPHLRSRHEVGDVLRASKVAVTEFRAAAIIGAGSLSFEMIHFLTNRLPVMICPRWVLTRTQPVSIDDVLTYLTDALRHPDSIGRIIDIGGPEVLAYRDMILEVARVLRLRRWLIEVPMLTPRLSSYWVGLVTPVPIAPARELIEGLRNETVCENDDALRIFPFKPVPFGQAVEKALGPVAPFHFHACQTAGTSIISRIEPSHLLSDRRVAESEAPADRLFAVVKSIGGKNGWYASDALWQIRGLIDEACGGVGLRRGRVNQEEMAVGEALDFWRVEEFDPKGRLLLRAEMKVPGLAWLEFEAKSRNGGRSQLIQTARFYPRGVLGIMYWYSMLLVHEWVFRRMARAIARRAEDLAK